MMASATVVMMREEPGDPRTRSSLPSFRTIVGVMEESGRLPGPIALASLWIRPSLLGAPAFAEKSSIELYGTSRGRAGLAGEPNQSLMVVVTETALPSGSTTE